MTESENPAGSPDRTARFPGLGTLLGALALPAATALVCGSIPPEPGEALWLRWLRVLDDHPVRAFLAAALLFLAFAPGRPREHPPRS